MFSYMAEVPLSEYIRNRRLSRAAVDLQNGGDKVIDVAVKYGYDSPTAFTRAFQAFHGVTPTAPPAWCGGWIIAKDSYNVCGFSPESKQYFLLEVKSGAPSFGDYLASTGSVKRVVTYSNIDNTTLQGESQQYCCVRVWEPV